MLLTERENVCLDKKNPCGGNNHGPNDLSSHKFGKKKPRFTTTSQDPILIQSFLPVTPNQSFKTRTDLTGRIGTRPTRAWDRSGWRQKPAWKLAWGNPVKPG